MRRGRHSAIDLLPPVHRSSTESYGRLSVYDYAMSRSASSQDDTRPPLRAPLWGDLLDRAVAQILAAPTSAGRSRMALVESASEATDQAEFRLVHTLERDAPPDGDVVAKSVAEAVTLMTAVDALSQRDLSRAENEHPDLVQQFRRRLSGHEDAVLAGETTYSVRPEEGQESATRIRHALREVAQNEGTSLVRLTVLRNDAIDLAARLLLVAANIAAGGSASEAPEKRTAALDRTLESTVRQLTVQAEAVERPIDSHGDVVAHHLAAALRVRMPSETLDGLETSSASESAAQNCRDVAKDVWFRLAVNEYVAIKELDRQLETPAYGEAFDSLSGVMLEGAANVICGARLLGRPSSFRHHKAWGHQTIGLTYALEAYVAGLITLTRLTRAITAIAMLEPRREARPTNGRPKR
jgi:hypothetical protein